MTNWFGAKLRFAIIVEQLGLRHYMDSVILFEAEDFENAFNQALRIGRAKEQEYRNGDGQLVRWRLVEVLSLDKIKEENLDGAEICSEPVFTADPSVAIDHQFHPEISRPTQTM